MNEEPRPVLPYEMPDLRRPRQRWLIALVVVLSVAVVVLCFQFVRTPGPNAVAVTNNANTQYSVGSSGLTMGSNAVAIPYNQWIRIRTNGGDLKSGLIVALRVTCPSGSPTQISYEWILCDRIGGTFAHPKQTGAGKTQTSQNSFYGPINAGPIGLSWYFGGPLASMQSGWLQWWGNFDGDHLEISSWAPVNAGDLDQPPPDEKWYRQTGPFP
jgi:hypothetical protein